MQLIVVAESDARLYRPAEVVPELLAARR